MSRIRSNAEPEAVSGVGLRARRPRRRILGLVLIALALALLFVAGRSSLSTAIVEPQSAPPGTVGGRGVAGRPVFNLAAPAGEAATPPATFDETGAGARAAAIAYASQVEQKMLYLDDAHVESAQRQISAGARVDQLLDERRHSVATWRASVEGGQGQLWWVVTPLAAKVETFTPTQARVRVWVAFVVSRSGAAAPRVWFGIQTVDLVRERNDWKVWAETLDPGPNPQLAPTSKPTDATGLDERLAGFGLIETDR